MIYKITNTINNKFYIGMTSKTIQERFDRHLRNVKYGGDTHLYNAMRKYGPENFLIEEVCEGMDEKEIEMISKLKPQYNQTEGGTGGDTSKSEKFINSMKEYHAKKPREEYATYGMKDKNHSEDTKTLQSKKRKEHWDSLSDEELKERGKKVAGSNNGMFGKTPKNAMKVIYNDTIYNSKAEATRKTGMSWFKLEKNGAKVI